MREPKRQQILGAEALDEALIAGEHDGEQQVRVQARRG